MLTLRFPGKRLKRSLISQRTFRITHSVSGVASHPEDDRVLEAARSADADYLVTGEGPFQKVESYGGVAIISPRTFRDILDQHSVSR